MKVDGVIEDRQHVVCPMPKLNRLGTVPFALQLYDGTQLIFEDTRHTFYSGGVSCMNNDSMVYYMTPFQHSS